MTGSTAERLPSEIKTHITSYCSPVTLTSLALVHRSFQVEAEQALYAAIAVTSSKSSQRLSVFETLAANQEKAAYIHFLQVMYRCHSAEHDIAAKALMTVLPTLVSLKDLRIRFDYKEQPFSKELTDILSSRHFELHILFCNEWLGISKIVKSQSSLQCLGFYQWCASTLPALEQLHTESIPIPITFRMERADGIGNGTHITLFPAYLSPETRSTIFQTLESIISRDRGSSELSFNQISEVTLYFESIGDKNYVSNFVLDMTVIFPNVWQMTMLWKRPEKALTEIMQIITPVRKLEYLDFGMWAGEDGARHRYYDSYLTDDRKRHYALEWEGVCPDLRDITFFDASYVQKVESGWVLNS